MRDWAPGVVVRVGGLTSRPWVQSLVEAGKRVGLAEGLGGEGAASETADGKKWLTSTPPSST